MCTRLLNLLHTWQEMALLIKFRTENISTEQLFYCDIGQETEDRIR